MKKLIDEIQYWMNRLKQSDERRSDIKNSEIKNEEPIDPISEDFLDSISDKD